MKAYDLSEKEETYAKAGITEYWVIDLKQQQVYVFRNPTENAGRLETGFL